MTKHYSFQGREDEATLLLADPTADALIEAALAHMEIGAFPRNETWGSLWHAVDVYLATHAGCDEAHDCCEADSPCCDEEEVACNRESLAERVQVLENTQGSLCAKVLYQEQRIDAAHERLRAHQARLNALEALQEGA